MFKILFLLFLIVPIVEIAILIEIGRVFGVSYTILLVIGTAALGAALFRIEGLSTLARVQQQMDRGILPATELLEGLLLLISGALLLTPGFFTDVIGFLILVPGIRSKIAQSLLVQLIQSKVDIKQTSEGNIIEGEWKSDSKED